MARKLFQLPIWSRAAISGSVSVVSRRNRADQIRDEHNRIEKELAAIGAICQQFVMPTILRVNGYQFYFYAQEGNEPPHIHVAKGGFDAKFWLLPGRLAVNHGFKAHDLREIAGIIEANETLIVEKWNEFFRP